MSFSDPVFEALWKKCLDDWDDDRAHGKFLQHCQDSEQLAEAAARYRGMAGDRDRGPSAEKRLQAVALLAMAQLESMRTTRPRRGRAVVNSVIIALFLVGIGVLLHLMMTS